MRYNRQGQEIRNGHEIRLFGMRRSGIHGVLIWLAHQLPKPCLFINCCTHWGDPYDFLAQDYTVPDLFPKLFIKNTYEQREALRAVYKDYLMLAYEDVDVLQLPHYPALNSLQKHVGISLIETNILLLRDPFNMTASRLKNVMDHRAEARHTDITANALFMWKSYAKEFLGMTKFFHRKVNVNYNQWFVDAEYREQISGAVGLPMKNASVDHMMPCGNGSSFDYCAFSDRASQMDVLNRWQKYKDLDEYRQIFAADEEVLFLSDLIFGKIPGTEDLFRRG